MKNLLLVLVSVSAFGLFAKPLVIGLADVCQTNATSRRFVAVSEDYCASVYASGNIPFVVPATTNRAAIAQTVAMLDVLVLCGGEDVEPSRYHAEKSPHCGRINFRRDAWEFALMDEAVKRRLPVVGTCRGHQLINVYFGGTLHQDLPTECPSPVAHNGDNLHPISVEPGSRLAAIMGCTNAVVNTWHHQAVKDVAPGFRVTARAPDGVIEAIEATDRPVASVQFHPEKMFDGRGEKPFLRFFTHILDWAGTASARCAERRLPFKESHPVGLGARIEGNEAVCDNGTDSKAQRGLHWRLKLDQTEAAAFAVTAESLVEVSPGVMSRGYSLYLDITYADGSNLYGQVVEFPIAPGRGWKRRTVRVAPDKPVRSVNCYLLFRNVSGRVRFREPTYSACEGRDFVQYDMWCQETMPRREPGPGFLLRDAAEERGFVPIAPGGSAEGVSLEVRREARADGAAACDVTLRSAEARDRAISLVYALPIPGTEPFAWHDDPRTSVTLKATDGQRRVTTRQGAGEGQLARWPFGAVTADGRGLALGCDPSAPAVFRVTANPRTRELLIAFDVGFAPEKREAHFRFVSFGFPGAQAFRGALASYQRLFPANHVVRLKRHGLWMAFRRISEVQGFEDFGFAVKEGDNESAWDDAHGLVTFHYTEPTSWWMPMKGKAVGSYTLADCLAEAERRVAEKSGIACAWVAAGYHDAEGGRVGSVRDTPWCKGAVWSLCPLPGIAGGEYALKLTGPAWEKRYAGLPPAGVDGEYIDSAEPYMTPALDFTRAHFAASVTPLAYDPVTKRPAVAKCLSVYEYVRGAADRCHAMDRYLMGNGIPYNWPWLVPFSDFCGQETDWMDRKTGAWRPMSERELLYRRAMCGGKPYCFLMNTDFARFGPEFVDRYMQRALAYGFFASFFSASASSSQGHYFTRPELYNRDRAMFRKYVPICRTISEAGWRAVNDLAVSETDGVHVEQFGDRYLTVFNPGTVPVKARIRLLRKAVTARELVVGGEWAFASGVAEEVVPAESVRVLEFPL